MDTPRSRRRFVVVALVIWAMTLPFVAIAMSYASDHRPAARQGRDGNSDKPPKQFKPKFTISKETTHVKGPVDKDGFIDYATALHERMRVGVTPENNANVLLWKAMGPNPRGMKMPAYFFDWLAVEAPPKNGSYFVDFERYMKEQLKGITTEQKAQLNDQFEAANKRAWTAEQYPHVAAWLKANEEPLALVVEASKRPRYYSPLAPEKSERGPTPRFGSQVAGVVQSREFGRALAARAMLRVGHGRYDDAWQDLLACHRLARLVSRGPQFIDALVGIALEANAGEADLAFLERAPMDAKRIKDCLRELQVLPPMRPIIEIAELAERFFLLDHVMMVNRHGFAYIEALSAAGLDEKTVPQPKPNPVAELFFDNVNYDTALRNVNRWFDRAVAAMRLQDQAARAKQLHEIEEAVKDLRVQLFPGDRFRKAILGTAEQKGEIVGDILVVFSLPALRKVQHAADRTEQIQRNLRLAFALAAYQRDHGRYPLKLDALAPDYLTAIPLDLFTGKPLVYRPAENGYVLYSFGVNGRDDEARYYDDDPPGDDPSVRMPLPALPRRN